MVRIILRFTSIQLYKMLLEDIYAQALKKDGEISKDIYLLFDEMYLQKMLGVFSRWTDWFLREYRII